MKEKYFRVLHDIVPETPSVFEPTIEAAIKAARAYGGHDGGKVLVTGSLYLVGGALRIIDPVV